MHACQNCCTCIVDTSLIASHGIYNIWGIRWVLCDPQRTSQLRWCGPLIHIQNYHDDVIKWKHFPHYWSFVRGIHRSRWIPHTQRPATRSFDVFLDLRLNKRLSKQSWGWWFETQSRPLWRQCNASLTPWHFLWLWATPSFEPSLVLHILLHCLIVDWWMSLSPLKDIFQKPFVPFYIFLSVGLLVFVKRHISDGRVDLTIRALIDGKCVALLTVWWGLKWDQLPPWANHFIHHILAGASREWQS